MKLSIFWFRRDLRLDDNTALINSLKSGFPVLPVFIFDTEIITELERTDARITFIYNSLQAINNELKKYNSAVKIFVGSPLDVWKTIIEQYEIEAVFVNRDYEPYSMSRDANLKTFLQAKGINFFEYKDQVIFEKNEIVKEDGNPYTVFTPYKNKWLQKFNTQQINCNTDVDFKMLFSFKTEFPKLSEIGFKESKQQLLKYNLSAIANYAENRDFPAINSCSNLSPHLRFGTVSIRWIINMLQPNDSVFLSELIWREFFMQILYNFPKVVNRNFREKYDGIKWRNNTEEFELWCNGKTGYPLVDAAMQQLNSSGYMHNRTRMICAGFACKHLLIDWQWGEAYFAKKLLDFELASNNGNWQWAAGTGCDAAPYFRVFNPVTQQQKFDKDFKYIKHWLPNYSSNNYIQPIVEHSFARQRAIDTYKKGIGNL